MCHNCIKNISCLLSKERMTKSDFIGKLTNNVSEESVVISEYQEKIGKIREEILENFRCFLKNGRIILTTKDLIKEKFIFSSSNNNKLMVLTAIDICSDNIYLYGFNEEKLTNPSKEDFESLIWDSLSGSLLANNRNTDFLLKLVRYLDRCGLIKELRTFTVLVTVECDIKARSLAEAIEMGYRTSASDIEGNDITSRVTACTKK